jgi:hypothetical protein
VRDPVNRKSSGARPGKRRSGWSEWSLRSPGVAPNAGRCAGASPSRAGLLAWARCRRPLGPRAWPRRHPGRRYPPAEQTLPACPIPPKQPAGKRAPQPQPDRPGRPARLAPRRCPRMWVPTGCRAAQGRGTRSVPCLRRPTCFSARNHRAKLRNIGATPTLRVACSSEKRFARSRKKEGRKGNATSRGSSPWPAPEDKGAIETSCLPGTSARQARRGRATRPSGSAGRRRSQSGQSVQMLDRVVQILDGLSGFWSRCLPQGARKKGLPTTHRVRVALVGAVARCAPARTSAARGAQERGTKPGKAPTKIPEWRWKRPCP